MASEERSASTVSRDEVSSPTPNKAKQDDEYYIDGDDGDDDDMVDDMLEDELEQDSPAIKKDHPKIV